MAGSLPSVVIRNPNNVNPHHVHTLHRAALQPYKEDFPFSRVPEEKKQTTWGFLTAVPVIYSGIYIFLRPLIRIIVSVIVVNYK